MDPNTALTVLRCAIAALRADVDTGVSPDDHEAMREHADAAVDAFDALDQWLCAGGFPPRDWKPPRGILRRTADSGHTPEARP